MADSNVAHPLASTDRFIDRHLGPRKTERQAMLQALGFRSIDELISKAVPSTIQFEGDLDLPEPQSEADTLRELKAIAEENRVFRSYIGMGYAETVTPPVIQRNILENPGWYTQYTPYQAEIAQGRLEALFNFQTVVTELTGLEIANSSLLDEGTAAAEAVSMASRVNRKNKSTTVFVSEACHPQTIDVVKTRSEPLGLEVIVGDHREFDFDEHQVSAALVQYPDTHGYLLEYDDLADTLHDQNALLIVAADLLSLVALRAPADFGADIVVGSSQRLGVPLGFGGPHAAYMACREAFKRSIPGRIIGESVDAEGNSALRLALQTREQHIRRERATSNICTAQVLLAVIASMYACYHGPEGLRAITARIHRVAQTLARGLERLGFELSEHDFFDTLHVLVDDAEGLRERAEAAEINLRYFDDGSVGITVDEATTAQQLVALFHVFNGGEPTEFDLDELVEDLDELVEIHRRSGPFMTQEVFHQYHSETELLRYMHRLQSRDLSLTTSMIPLGSCTMKLNATAEMLPVTWEEFGNIHPFAPREQTAGYRELFSQLESWLNEITGMDATSLQPNAGSQGEYAGMLVIKRYHEEQGDLERDVCLIPESAHGTNPASAIMAGMKVVAITCDDDGNIDLKDLREKAAEHAERLAAIMVTYPSTHGVFETHIREVCDTVHEHGGQVYLDGANMNAQVGICRPGDYGADVCHLNLHKTFCIPHGGGGPGMGPICVRDHLAAYLPGHVVIETGGSNPTGAVSSAPWGSPSILPISWAYIRMLGARGLREATEVAILNANYMAHRLDGVYDVLYKGAEGQVAHEFILDMRGFKESADISVADIAKRLMDYGFHAPTMSWPVAGTVMVEPTESESKAELDRFCEAMISIRAEIQAIEDGRSDREDNPLRNAPHPAHRVMADEWTHSYSREQAAYPDEASRAHKFWPSVSRVDNAHGDRNLVCSCPPMTEYAAE